MGQFGGGGGVELFGGGGVELFGGEASSAPPSLDETLYTEHPLVPKWSLFVILGFYCSYMQCCQELNWLKIALWQLGIKRADFM